ncbi:transcription intermediary factor 1-beta-like [Ruditapes philippinarum]|uniref:transcription intermediary factor 1-beta-like n=1 Tax=Ruditapes philippinarum TaxID=129788 RepID=UPI00295B03D9|nr:transcription intermediary factor 1-beta-like [Ruditapes philippinarum]
MATSKDFTNISKDSEEMFDICCSSCSDDNKTIQAKKFCVECGLNFCENCVKFHKKIPLLQSHEIVDVTQVGKGEVKQVTKELPTERCNIHHGKLMDMFCKDHDEVCCGVCIALKHRACVNIDYVPDIAKAVINCKEYQM